MTKRLQSEQTKFIARDGEATRAMVIVPVMDRERGGTVSRSVSARLEEVLGLAHAIDLDIVFSDYMTVAQPKAATLLGSGKVEELTLLVSNEKIALAVIDHSLTPVQQRNLEKAWDCKVIDRTALILEIFGERARTREGGLQVELAHLNYQKGRLVRSWTHLERQRGGSGFLGGPGETQIEADRRLLQEKINRIRRELDTVVKTRQLHRAKRKKIPCPVIALVGYTNAGKSTLFNRLTGAGVLAEDMLFATLDPTLRRIKLPHGETVILSDTVGFISNLPAHLVAAFRATLEEVVEADLIIHVRDMSDPDHMTHRQDVLDILSALDVDIDDPGRMIEVWNKIDLLDHDTAQYLESAAEHASLLTIPVSAVSGQGINALVRVIENRIAGEAERVHICLEPQELTLLDWLYRHGSGHQQSSTDDGGIMVAVNLTRPALRMFQIKRDKLKTK